MIAHPRQHAAARPNHPALILDDTGETLTYGELTMRADQAAGLFAAAGLIEGDTVAFLLENHIRYPELLWAAKNSGIRYVCVSTHLNAADTAYVLADCGAKLLVTSAAQETSASAAIAEMARPPILLMIDGATPPFASYEDALARQTAISIEGRRRGPSMLYSSGTTGRPKGVRTSIPDASPEEPPQRFAMLQSQYGFGRGTIFLNPGPFYHSAPNRFMMSVLRAGGTVVAFRQFDASKVLAAIGHYRATHGFFVPTMFARMLALSEQERAAVDPSSMRYAIHAAAPCPIDVKRRMIGWWGPVIEELYAGTEAFGHTFISSAEWLAHPGSVGRPAPGCTIKIVAEDGVRLAVGQPGRVMMSNGLRIAYHGDEAKTAALYDDEGFASLGDVGYLDEDGYLYLTDRESHMIIAGGVNIYPQEAEMVIGRHPDVADVAVLGIPDDDMGEAVHGVVELRPGSVPNAATAADIIGFCRDHLSLHKCPRSIDFVGMLPRTPVGKLAKRELRERYWKHANRLI